MSEVHMLANYQTVKYRKRKKEKVLKAGTFDSFSALSARRKLGA